MSSGSPSSRAKNSKSTLFNPNSLSNQATYEFKFFRKRPTTLVSCSLLQAGIRVPHFFITQPRHIFIMTTKVQFNLHTSCTGQSTVHCVQVSVVLYTAVQLSVVLYTVYSCTVYKFVCFPSTAIPNDSWHCIVMVCVVFHSLSLSSCLS